MGVRHADGGADVLPTNMHCMLLVGHLTYPAPHPDAPFDFNVTFKSSPNAGLIDISLLVV